MLCPKCRNKKGQPVRIDPVTRKCPKCNSSVSVDHTGKHVVRGAAAAKPQAAEKK